MYPLAQGVQLTPAPGRGAWGLSLCLVSVAEGCPMADYVSPIQFEDVPLDEARRMGRGTRMEPLLYDTLRKKIQSLTDQAARIRIGPEIRPERMRNYILRI